MATDQGRCKRRVNPAADDALGFVRGLMHTSINCAPTAPTVTLALNGTAKPTPGLKYIPLRSVSFPAGQDV